MKKVVPILRILILLALSTVAIYSSLFSEPAVESTSEWLLTYIASLAVGFVAAVVFFILLARWINTDKWLRAYRKWNDKAIDNW